MMPEPDTVPVGAESYHRTLEVEPGRVAGYEYPDDASAQTARPVSVVAGDPDWTYVTLGAEYPDPPPETV